MPTAQEIEDARTPRGGWTKKQLAEWGVPWPPPKGWRQKLLAPSRVIVCGSRNWTDRDAIANRLFDLSTDTVIVHGGAHGADRIAGQEAEKLGLLVETHAVEHEDYAHYGNRAYFLRNERMAKLGADLCIAFWDGRSRGTEMMVGLAEKHGIPIELYTEGRP